MVMFNMTSTTMAFNNVEQFDGFNSRVIRLQQEITLSGENISPTRRFSKNMKALSKSDKLKELIATNMIDLIKFLDNNRKSAVYTGGGNHGIYRYLEMIGSPTTLTTSVQRSHHFGTSFPSKMINNLSRQLLKLST